MSHDATFELTLDQVNAGDRDAQPKIRLEFLLFNLVYCEIQPRLSRHRLVVDDASAARSATRQLRGFFLSYSFFVVRNEAVVLFSLSKAINKRTPTSLGHTHPSLSSRGRNAFSPFSLGAVRLNDLLDDAVDEYGIEMRDDFDVAGLNESTEEAVEAVADRSSDSNKSTVRFALLSWSSEKDLLLLLLRRFPWTRLHFLGKAQEKEYD